MSDPVYAKERALQDAIAEFKEKQRSGVPIDHVRIRTIAMHIADANHLMTTAEARLVAASYVVLNAEMYLLRSAAEICLSASICTCGPVPNLCPRCRLHEVLHP